MAGSSLKAFAIIGRTPQTTLAITTVNSKLAHTTNEIVRPALSI